MKSINKTASMIIKENFEKSIKSYFSHATAQKKMAQRLIELLCAFLKENALENNFEGNFKGNFENAFENAFENVFENIFEIGSYDGMLTKIANEKLCFKNYMALDIVNSSKDYMKKINPEIKFLNCDIETFLSSNNKKVSEKYDLILSNAALQWVFNQNNFRNILSDLFNILSNRGFLAISTFEEDNLFELNRAFSLKERYGAGLDYISKENLREFFEKNSIDYKIIAGVEEKISLKFDSPFEVLRHLKQTGTNFAFINNSIRGRALSYLETKRGLEILDKEFNNTITYKPLYVICFKKF